MYYNNIIVEHMSSAWNEIWMHRFRSILDCFSVSSTSGCNVVIIFNDENHFDELLYHFRSFKKRRLSFKNAHQAILIKVGCTLHINLIYCSNIMLPWIEIPLILPLFEFKYYINLLGTFFIFFFWIYTHVTYSLNNKIK